MIVITQVSSFVYPMGPEIRSFVGHFFCCILVGFVQIGTFNETAVLSVIYVTCRDFFY